MERRLGFVICEKFVDILTAWCALEDVLMEIEVDEVYVSMSFC